MGFNGFCGNFLGRMAGSGAQSVWRRRRYCNNVSSICADRGTRHKIYALPEDAAAAKALSLKLYQVWTWSPKAGHESRAKCDADGL